MVNRERIDQMFNHYHKRLKKYGFKETDGNMHVFRTTGSPCSCIRCAGEKYNRKQKHKKNYINDIFEIT